MSNNNDLRPTLKTISEVSGLAVATVSRALKDAPDLSENTKARVKQIAKDLGYVPNRAGVRLRTGKTNVIALTISTSDDIIGMTGRLISIITRNLSNTPYHLLVAPDDDPTTDQLSLVKYIVETNSADVIILDRIEPQDARVRYLMEKKFPFVTLGRTKWCDGHAYFDFDNVAFGRIAAQRLINNSRRHLTLVSPPMGQSYAQHMIQGANEVLNGIDSELNLVTGMTDDSTGEEVRSRVLNYLKENPQTDALICASTTSTVATLAALEQAGRKLGDDIDLFTKESVSFLGYFRPQVFSVTENINYAGEFLAKAAIQAIEQPAIPPLQAVEVPKPRPKNLKIADWHFE